MEEMLSGDEGTSDLTDMEEMLSGDDNRELTEEEKEDVNRLLKEYYRLSFEYSKGRHVTMDERHSVEQELKDRAKENVGSGMSMRTCNYFDDWSLVPAE